VFFIEVLRKEAAEEGAWFKRRRATWLSPEAGLIYVHNGLTWRLA